MKLAEDEALTVDAIVERALFSSHIRSADSNAVRKKVAKMPIVVKTSRDNMEAVIEVKLAEDEALTVDAISSRLC